MERKQPVSRDRRKFITLIIGFVLTALVSGGSAIYMYRGKLSEARQDTLNIVADFERSIIRPNESISKGKIREVHNEPVLSKQDFIRLQEKYSEDVSIFIIDDDLKVKWKHNVLEINRNRLSHKDGEEFYGTENVYANGRKFKVYRVFQSSSRNKSSYYHDVMRSWKPYYEQWVISVIAVFFLSILVLVLFLEKEKSRTRIKRFDATLDLMLERAHVFTKDAPTWPNNFRIAAHDIKGHISNLLDSVGQVYREFFPERWENVREKFEEVENEIDYYFNKLWHKLKHDDVPRIDIVQRCKEMLKPNKDTGLVPALYRISTRKEFESINFPEGFLTLRLQGIPDSLYVNFDEDLFRVVLDELLLNAARAAKTIVVVTVKQDETESRIARIVIENDGERFPVEGRKGLLLLGGKRQRKNMVDTSGGMGLPSVRHIVCDFFGDLSLEDSDELGGARVVLEMPLADEKDNDVSVK